MSLEVNVEGKEGIPLKTTKKMSTFVRGPVGSVDTTYGANGYVRTVFGEGVNPFLFAAAETAGTKLTLLGQAGGPQTGGTVGARFDESGKLDTSYGTGGFFILEQRYAQRGGIGVDGTMIFAGGGSLCRATAAGKLDPTFGVDGDVEGCVQDSNISAASLLKFRVESPSTFVVASAGIGLWRYKNSALDSSVWGMGKTNYSFSVGTSQLIAHRTRKEGVIIVGSFTQANVSGYGTARVLFDGTMDLNFGTKITSEPACTTSEECVGDMVERSDGSFVVLTRPTEDGPPRLYGFTPLGKPDNAFGTGGISAPVAVQGAARQLVLMSDGRLVTVTDGRFLELVRYDAKGAIDAELGAPVKISLDPTLKANGYADPQMVLTKDDRLLLAFSQSLGPNRTDFLIVRVWN